MLVIHRFDCILLQFTFIPIHICRIFEANLCLAKCSEIASGITLSSVQQQHIDVDCRVIAFAVDILNGFAETGKRSESEK